MNIRKITFFLLILCLFLNGFGKTAESDLQSFRALLSQHNRELEYNYFTPKNLFDLINGGAELYINKGLVHGIHQRLLGPDSTQVNVMYMVMKSPRRAKSLYKNQLRDSDGYQVFEKYSSSVASYQPVFSGISAQAHVDKIYVEVTITGLIDSDPALQLVENLLAKLKQKVD